MMLEKDKKEKKDQTENEVFETLIGVLLHSLSFQHWHWGLSVVSGEQQKREKLKRPRFPVVLYS
jgi:cell division protein FtsI/penicillin-binding protein 2